MELVDTQGFSGGIWVFWDDSFEFKAKRMSDQMVHDIVNKGKADEWWLTVVYGSPSSSRCRLLWENLARLSDEISCGWVVIGDYNATLKSEERMIDIGFNGLRFIWNRGKSYSHIDKVSVNSVWHLQHLHASVTHLPKFKSDHNPLWLKLDNSVTYRCRNRPFRFFALWVMHESFGDFVKDSWTTRLKWNENVSMFTEKVLKWTKEVFGNIYSRKDFLYRWLDGINRKLASTGPSHKLDKLRSDLWNELEVVLAQEEVMWLQKS